MQRTLVVRCPNCGSFAKRHLWSHQVASQSHRDSQAQVIRTECPHCDYLMTVCQDDSTIYSVYSPVVNLLSSKRATPHSKHS